MARPGRPASEFPVCLEQFEGPLDLLLEEVRRQNVAIDQVAMAPMVARYLEYIRTAREGNLNLDIEWLHMAATLIHWKSQALLPRNPDERSVCDPIRDDLVQQLLAYKKQAAGELARRQAVEEARFSRGARGEFSNDAAAGDDDEGDLSIWQLMQQAREIAEWIDERRAARRWLGGAFTVSGDDTTVEAMIQYLRRRLISHDGRLEFLDTLREQPPAHRPLLFLGLLEMARQRNILVEQSESFGPIWLEHGESDDL